MNPAGSYEYMVRDMNNRYDREIPTIVGILFANPNKAFVKDEIIENIEYANVRSGLYIDFFFAGYSAYSTYDKQEKIIPVSRESNWYFSFNMFNDFIEQLEQISNWEYTGETELLLLEFRQGGLCFDNIISIWLDREVKEGTIYSIANLFSMCQV